MKTHGLEFSSRKSQWRTSLTVKRDGIFILNSYYKFYNVLGVCIAEMTRKWKKEQRTMDGNYEKKLKVYATTAIPPSKKRK